MTMSAPEDRVDVPFTDLSEAALRGVVETFVLREGTDYGTHEFTLDQKVQHVLGQLKDGAAKLVFDPKSSTVDIVRCTARKSD